MATVICNCRNIKKSIVGNNINADTVHYIWLRACVCECKNGSPLEHLGVTMVTLWDTLGSQWASQGTLFVTFAEYKSGGEKYIHTVVKKP